MVSFLLLNPCSCEYRNKVSKAFRLASIPDFSEPDLVLVAKKNPQGIICLISALSYYELTTQIPHFVYVALPRTSRLPKSGYPPLRCPEKQSQMFWRWR